MKSAINRGQVPSNDFCPRSRHSPVEARRIPLLLKLACPLLAASILFAATPAGLPAASPIGAKEERKKSHPPPTESLAIELENAATDPVPSPAEVQRGYKPLTAALHVHSRFSDGQYEIYELAAYAHQRKLDVLGFTDSFLTKVRYGVGPGRKLISYAASRESVLSHGIEKYFSDVRDAQRRFEGVVLLPGLEVTPFYYWRGSPLGGLRLFDFDRHLLVFGLQDFGAVRNLPVIENETLANTSIEWFRVAGPFLLLVAGVMLLAARRERIVRLKFYTLRKRRNFSSAGLLCLAMAGVWAFREYPFGTLADPYSSRHSAAPYQRVIDYARRNGAVVFWSYPEARYSDVEVGGARMISTGHPEDLALSDRYHGFEGIYGDRITITQPGNVWDRLLMEYLSGGRESWPSVITGIDFHSFKGGGWYELDRGQTVLWTKEKTQTAVLDALRSGRGYAAFQAKPGLDLRLRTFVVSSEGSSAISGETLETRRPVVVRAWIDLSRDNPGGSAAAGRLLIIRDAEPMQNLEAELPVRFEKEETLQPGRHYYRLRFDYEGYQVLSNPIFVNVR